MHSNTVVKGPGFLSLLALLFIALKLCGVIAWSWCWVLAPLWMPLGFLCLFLLVFGTIICVAAIVDSCK